ncbi:hypothetical protein AWRI1631_80640 [Saccharomyces cerevisiae AWRI1631]|uniref:Uncharacterized protein n=1 Tax=Saccharomyces cerevisiae (strain AWRI1631) TaxID=545124 RepID=B5VJU3_YEAS6|nr:hypothetical protein AWRI1631_80640 [Saccharomyces cerevisiae AWRI1631]
MCQFPQVLLGEVQKLQLLHLQVVSRQFLPIPKAKVYLPVCLWKVQPSWREGKLIESFTAITVHQR